MKTLLALDSFKGCLTASEAVWIAGSAMENREALKLPLSDGGEGFTECVVQAIGGRYRTITVHDPLGRPIEARYGLVQDGRIAVIETAAAGGLTLLAPSELDPWNASSFGVGEMILDAVNQKVKLVWIGLGGTAVMDGGIGMLHALDPYLPLPVQVHAFYDVDVRLRDAARVFGPQKGADMEMVERLEKRFINLSDQWRYEFGLHEEDVPGTGAAGGIGAALTAVLGAEMHRGIDAVLRTLSFHSKISACQLVITGEGKADRQTLTGKVPYGVLEEVRYRNPYIPVVLIAGRVEDRDALLEAGFADVVQMTPDDEPNPLDKEVATRYLREATRRVVQHFKDLRGEE